MTDPHSEAAAPAQVIGDIEFEINQWFAGEGNLRDCAERIHRLLGCNPIISATKGDSSAVMSDMA